MRLAEAPTSGLARAGGKNDRLRQTDCPLRVETTRRRAAACGHRVFIAGFPAMNPIGWSSQPDPLLSSAALTRAAVMQRKEPVASARFLAVQLHESWSWSAVVRVGQHWILWCRPDRTANPTSITATRLCFSPGIRLQSIDATQRVYVVAFRTAVLQSSPCRREKTHRSARSPS